MILAYFIISVVFMLLSIILFSTVLKTLKRDLMVGKKLELFTDLDLRYHRARQYASQDM